MSAELTDSNRLQPITAESVVEQVTQELRRSILNATLAPGEKLSLRQVANQLGVSFIPVREALRVLEAQGLVVSERSRSSRVALLDPAELRAIYRLRIQVEPDITARATTERESLVRLEDLLEDLADPELTLDERHAVHSAFHLELMHPAASDWDLRVLDMLWNSAQRYIRFAFDRRERDPDEPRRRYEAHAMLLDVARSRDPERMRTAVCEHLQANQAIALEGITGATGSSAVRPG